MGDYNATVTTSIYPNEWIDQKKLKGLFFISYGLITTGYTASANIRVSSANGEVKFAFNVPEKTGADAFFIGKGDLVSSQDPAALFPLKIEADISYNSSFNSVSGPQVALGSKISDGVLTPVSYLNNIFVNDAGGDNDWNDLVLSFQLFSESAD